MLKGVKEKFAGRESFGLYFIILTSLLGRILFLGRNLGVWWDSSVYVGMGKLIFSGGRVGLWESIRPVFLPSVLGLGWKAGLNPVTFGRVFEILLSLGSILLVYEIGRRLFDREFGLVASAIFAFTSLFVYYSVRILTGVPSIFFGLASVYFLLRDENRSYLLCGFFAALSFMTRFPQGILLLGLVLTLALRRLNGKDDTLKNIALVLLPFFLTLSPLIIFNCINYSSPLHPFIKATAVAKQNIWAHGGRFYFYLKHLALSNPLLILSVPGIFIYFKDEKLGSRGTVVGVLGVVYLAYFSMFPNKQLRFALIFLPYLALLSGYLLKRFWDSDTFGRRAKALVLVFLSLLLLYTAASGTLRYLSYFPAESTEADEFYRKAGNLNLKGKTVLSNTPVVAAYSDGRVRMMYRGRASVISEANVTYEEFKKEAAYTFLNTCHPRCPQGDRECESVKSSFFEKIDSEGKERFHTSYKGCEYIIYEL